jgi:hypothetical protein
MATEGVTDFRVNWSVPPGLTQATEVLTELTQTFRRTFAGTA